MSSDDLQALLGHHWSRHKEGQLNMRLLLEAIIASLGHYGNSLYVEIEMNPFELAEILDVEQSSERFAEIEKLSNQIRQEMGTTRTKARRLLELLKYRDTEHGRN